MNATDFQRNFAYSWLSVSMEWIKPFLTPEILSKLPPDVPSTARVPVHKPVFITDTTFRAKVVIPTITAPFGFFQQSVLVLPWSADLDERPAWCAGTPNIGMICNGLGLAFISINPIRGTSRGFCPSNCDIQYHGCDANDVIKNDTDITPFPSLAWNVFNPEYTDMHTALTLLAAGDRQGCPLSKYLGVITKPKKTHPILVYKNEYIASIRQNGTVFRMYRDISPAARRYLSKMYPTITLEERPLV